MLQERSVVAAALSINEHLESPSAQAGAHSAQHTLAKVRPGELSVITPRNAARSRSCHCRVFGGAIYALVTGPMQKSVMMDAGFAFSGHTEHLAQRSGVDDVVMMLATDAMRVALATTHLPLQAVSGELTQPLLERRLRILHHAMQGQFGLATPRLLVCGLNPHAGESGHMGREEIDIIAPVCEKLCAEGLLIRGPLPADTLFTPHYLSEADAVMAMFHDQGLPVLKYSGFGDAVNITLGLPFIRTSVDHGTALDLAGTGEANLSSFLAAVSAANTMMVQSGATT